MNVFLLYRLDTPYARDVRRYLDTISKLWTAEAEDTLTVMVYDPKGPIFDQQEDHGIRWITFSKRYREDDFLYLAGAARLGFLFYTLVDREIQRGCMPHVIEADAYGGIAHIILQQRYTHHPALQETRIIARVEHLLMLDGPANQAPMYHLPIFWPTEMERFVLRASDKVMSSCESLLDVIQRTVEVQYPGEFKSRPWTRQYGGDRVRPEAPIPKAVLYWGPVQRSSGVEAFLQAMRTLWKEDPSLLAEVVGGDTDDYLGSGSMTQTIARRFKGEIRDGNLILNGSPQDLDSFIGQGRVWTFLDATNPHSYDLWDVATADETVVVFDYCDSRLKQLPNVYPVPHDNPEALISVLRDILRRSCSHGGTGQVLTFDANPEDFLQSYKKWAEVPNRSVSFPFIRPPSKTHRPHQTQTFSVVMAFYNLGEYLRDALESIYRSTVLPQEILVINDGSREPESLARLWSLREEDYPGLSIVHQENQGIIEVRRRGASLATSPYVMFLDGDDKVTPTYFERCLAVLNQYDNVGFVGSWAQYFGNSDSVWPGWNPEFPYILYHNMINSSGIMVRREEYLRWGVSHRSMQAGLEDYQSVIAMMIRGMRGVVIPEPLFWYRVRPDSRSRESSTATKRWSLYQTLTALHETAYRTYALDLLNLLEANGPGLEVNTPLGPLPG